MVRNATAPRLVIGRWFAYALILAFFALFLVIVSPTLAQDGSVTPDVVVGTATAIVSEPVETPAPEATLILDQPADEPIVDVPPETAPVFTPPAPTDVFNGVLLALFSLFASGIASPLTAPIVSLVKRIPALSKIDPDTGLPRVTGPQINLGVAMILSILAWGAASLGFASQLDTVYRLIFAVLPVLTGAGGNFVANQSVYQYGKRKNIPILGYARTIGIVQRRGIPSPDELINYSNLERDGYR